MNRLARALWPWPAIVAGYALAAVAFTWPLARHLDSAIWGDRFDAWNTLWMLWFLHHAIVNGTLTQTATLVFYPIGYDLWTFGHIALQLLGVPLIGAGLSVTATFNLLGLGALTGTATASHALGRKLSGSHVGGLLAGSVLAFNPLIYGEFSVGSIELVAAFFVPLYVICLVRLAEQPTLRRAAVLAALTAIIGPFNWYFAIFCVLLTPPLALLLAVGRPRAPALRFAGLLLLAGAVVFLLTSPLLAKMHRESPPRTPLTPAVATQAAMERVIEFQDVRLELTELERADLEAFDSGQVVSNSMTFRALLPQSFDINPLDSTPGRIAMLLALTGLVADPRRGWRWLALAACFTLLSLGPFARWDAGSAPTDPEQVWKLPYFWLYNYLPFFSRTYRPYRLTIVTLTALAALAAFAGPWLRGVLGRWAGGGVALAVLALCATQPHWVAGHPARRGLSSTAVPAVYDRLAQLPEGALIELPMQSQPVHLGIAHFQYYQVRHARPILNVNPLTHIDDILALRDLAREHDLLALFLDLSDAQAVLRAQVTSAQVRALRDLGFRLVAVHDRFPADAGHITAPAERIGMLPGPAFALMEDLFGPALLEGDGVRFYDLERGVSRADAAPLPPHAWQEGTIGALDAFRTAHTPTLLPLSREPEAALLLGTAPPGRMLREVSLWVRAEHGTALAVRFRDGGGAQIGAPAPVDIAEHAWRWVRVVAPAGAVDAALVDTGADPLILSLTRAWLDTAPDPSLTAAPTEPGSTP